MNSTKRDKTRQGRLLQKPKVYVLNRIMKGKTAMVNTETKHKFYTAKTDRVFKTIMSRNPDILTSIISQALGQEVKFIKFINPELNINNTKERVKIVDVLIEADGVKINCEMNTEFDLSTRVRNQSYFASFYAQHVSRGKDYDINTKFVQINLSYGMSKKEPIKADYEFRTKDGKRREASLQIVDINMDKINEICYYGSENYESYKYLYMLDKEKEKLKEISREDKLMEKFKEEVEKVNSDPEFVWISEAEDREKVLRTQLNFKISKKIARNLLRENMPIDFVARNTGLSEEQIIKLK